LRYPFTINKPDNYHLRLRAHKRLEGEKGDKCNDCFVRMDGEFKSGNPELPLMVLQRDIKLFGGAADTWGVAQTLDIPSRKLGLTTRFAGAIDTEGGP